MYRIFFAILLFFLNTGCFHDLDKGGVLKASMPFTLDCSGVEDFSPKYDALEWGDPNSDVTLVYLHGKGADRSAYYTPSGEQVYSDALISRLLNSGSYYSIAPAMGWSKEWDGDLCASMNYLDALIANEKTQGNKVILIGHSMGAMNAIVYNALEQTTKPDAAIYIAAGHSPHMSPLIQSETESSVKTAREMLANGQGDATGQFIDINGGVSTTITTTANIYLSYYGLQEYPDIIAALPLTTTPALWISGSQDKGTSVYIHDQLFELIPEDVNNQYTLINAGHIDILRNDTTTSTINSWLDKI